MYRSFESITNWQRCDLSKIFVIPGGNMPTTLGEVIISKRGDWHEYKYFASEGSVSQ